MYQFELHFEQNFMMFSANSFHLPSDSSKPCILVGPGTGIAPFRSFWEQRIHLFKKQGGLLSLMHSFSGWMIKFFRFRFFRLIIDNNKLLGEKPGRMALLFGCRQPSDHCYKDEVEEALALGALSHSYTAFSRIPGTLKVCYCAYYCRRRPQVFENGIVN